MSNLYNNEKRESARIGGFINWCEDAGIIEDADLAGAGGDTITEVKANILANNFHKANYPLAQMLGKALDKGVQIAVFSETHGVTTVAGLVALTDAGATEKNSFFS